MEGRYPFLDRDVWDFLAPLAPEWKIRGLTDKYSSANSRNAGFRIASRPERKVCCTLRSNALHRAERPAWAEQLLSRESLQKTPYFDPEAVRHWMAEFPTMRHGFRRLFIEMGLVGVISTQLWHHLYIDSTLADLDPA